MLKITINNEEVVSNKDFTIEEEMLNTSSVILNNVYPKSWENDKDYVSRFYHPNDYSKCLIKDEDYTPAEPGLNEEGTNFQITADTTKQYELTSMKGNTTQSSTPTPTTPVPVNVVSGRQEVKVVGKNLLNVKDGTYSYSTVSWSVENHIVSLSSSDSSYQGGSLRLTKGIAGRWANRSDNHITTNGGTYTLSLNKSGTITYNNGFVDFYCFIYKDDGTNRNEQIIIRNNNNSFTKTITLASDEHIGEITLYSQFIQCENVEFKIMLEKGNQATTYEAYTGQSYEINLGKNLLDTIKTSVSTHGITFTPNSDGSIYVNGTSDGGLIVNILNTSNQPVLEAGTYTRSVKIVGTLNRNNINVSLTGRDTNNNNILGDLGLTGEGTFYRTTTLNEQHTISAIQIYIGGAGAVFDCTIYPQLEKGNTPDYNYAPYKTPIELCKIGNYQDRIYKNGNKWYLEKNIGKVVLNGSENWQSASSVVSGTSRFYYETNGIIKTSGANNIYYYCDKFKALSWNDIYNQDTTTNNAICVYGYSTPQRIQIRIDNTYANSVATFKTWLSTHNTIVYYVLATPTTTEITDTELISQLESIELLEGLNNVSVVSPYLQGIINLHYNFVNEETTSNLLFCGVVKNSGNISLNPRYPHYQSLQILDFKTFLSEGETLDFVIANKTIEEAIDQIISTISPYGFVKGNIQIIGAGTIIGAYSTKDKTAYDVFNYLADITQSRWTTRMIDENTVAVDFYDPTLLPQGTPINYNETWFRNNLIDDMTYSYGSNDYRNKQVMTSNEVYGSILQTQTMVANGYQTQFDTELKIGQITSITANGTQLTIATNKQKELGFNADIYYTPGNNYFESADLRSTGEILIVNYIAIVEGRQIITNGTEINRVATATGRKGIVARYENRNDANTSNELQLIGQSYIRYKGTPEIKLTIVSRKNLWNIGDRVQFNAPINELATEYMVKKKTINRILANPSSEEHIVYTYEMTSSFNSEQAINYFDNQRAKAKGNIGESEYITRNVDIENIANIIFYGSNVEQATITGDNTLQATLSSPIIN